MYIMDMSFERGNLEPSGAVASLDKLFSPDLYEVIDKPLAIDENPWTLKYKHKELGVVVDYENVLTDEGGTDIAIRISKDYGTVRSRMTVALEIKRAIASCSF